MLFGELSTAHSKLIISSPHRWWHKSEAESCGGYCVKLSL